MAARAYRHATARATDRRPRTSATSPITTTSPMRSTRFGSMRTWSTPAPISTTGATIIATAERQKLDMVCRKLRLKPGETMLDIGSGWGSLACHAAQHYGAQVVGVTLSEQQIAFAREKVERLGLADRVTFELRDYALMEGEARFDKISSVGMFEAIGIGALRDLFSHCPAPAEARRLLSAPRDHPPGRKPCRAHRQEAAGIPGADALHLPRRRTRLSRPHHHQSRAPRLRDPRRRVLAGALPAAPPASGTIV